MIVPILAPIFVLVLWTSLIQLWMVGTRVPALTKAGVDPQAAQRTADVVTMVPKEVQFKADNYNHLLEHPTLFYATSLALAVAGLGEGLVVALAWAYVVLRIAHSIVQTTVNIVMIRFTLFMLSSLALMAMAVIGAMRVL